MNPHSTHACVFACLLSSSAMLPTTVAAESKQDIQQGIYTISIKSGSLAQAIADIGQQTDTNIVVSQDLIADKVVSAMTKTASIDVILETLLLDTGLVYAEASEGVYLVAKPLTKTKEKTDAEFIANTDVEIIRVRSEIVDRLISSNTNIGALGTREIIDTPFSINAFSADFIQNVNALSIFEVASRDPSVSSDTNISGGAELFTIRGLGVDRFGILYDGIPGLTGSDGQLRPNNAERIEVFRGINAFNSGASTSVFGGVGGTVNIAVKRPGAKDVSYVFIGYQENGSLFYGADFSRRTGQNDQFGFRFNAFSQAELSNIDGFSREIALFSLFADWQVNDKFLLEGEISRNVDESISARTDLSVAPELGVPDVPDDLSVNYQAPFPWVRQTQNQNRFFVRANYSFNEDWSASIAYGEANGDTDNGYAVTFGTIVDEEGNVDLGTYVSPQNPQTGGGVAKIDGIVETGTFEHRLSLSATLTFFDFTADQEGPTIIGFSGLPSNIYNPPPVTQVTLPARDPADLIDVEIEQDIITYGGLYEVVALDGALSALLSIRRVTIDTSSIFDPVPYDISEETLLGSVSFKPNDDSTLYISYSEGAEAGLFAPFDAANANEVLPVTTPTQYEVGGKMQFGDAILSAAYFDIERPTTGFDENNFFRELGNQDFTGLELRAEGELFEGFRTVSGVTFYDVEINSSDTAINGKTLAGIPDYAASAYIEYDIAQVPGLTVTTGITYEGKQFLDNTNIPNREADSWTQIDVGGRYTFNVDGTAITAQLFVENITDEGYWNVDSFGGITLSLPRMVTATISAEF